MLIKFKRIIREPVLIFIISGSLLFFIYHEIKQHYADQNMKIKVTREQIDLLVESFESTWNRPPTEVERQGLIESHIKNEVFYREAVAIGLDKSDQAIKRRLRQVMELLIDDVATIYPSESQLQEYLASHPEDFKRDPKISFIHGYYPFEEKQKAFLDKNEISNGIKQNLSYSKLLSMVPGEYQDVSVSEISKTFGNAFSRSLVEMEMNTWQGPVESAYGWHLVKISAMKEGFVPPLDEIWDVVEREWSVARKQKLLEEQYSRMKEKYQVVMEVANEDQR